MAAIFVAFLALLMFGGSHPHCPSMQHTYESYVEYSEPEPVAPAGVGLKIDGIPFSGMATVSRMYVGTTTFGWRRATDTPEQIAHNTRVEECRTANGQF